MRDLNFEVDDGLHQKNLNLLLVIHMKKDS